MIKCFCVMGGGVMRPITFGNKYQLYVMKVQLCVVYTNV